MNYTCPVCGYDKLISPPANYHICPSCGTEFEYDDFATSHDLLLKQWIREGMPWHKTRTGPPPGWDPVVQIFQAGLGAALIEFMAREARQSYEAITLGTVQPYVSGSIKLTTNAPAHQLSTQNCFAFASS
jgi:hypothetical protein